MKKIYFCLNIFILIEILYNNKIFNNRYKKPKTKLKIKVYPLHSAMDIGKKTTKIHLDLESVFIIKTDLDKVIFGLFKYALIKGFKPPFIFTANTSIQDNSYLGVLKNNNVCLLDNSINEKDVDILFSKKFKVLNNLYSMPNIPIFTTISKSRACVYIDWDNIQVSSEYIPLLITGINRFINEIKVHKIYEFYAFLHNKISKNIKDSMKKMGVNVVNIIKDKSRSGDEEMFRFIRRNTKLGDSLCIASGDRDFSSIMVDYVRSSYNVFLLYNKQALFTFKNNKHWLGSIDVKTLKCYDIKNETYSIQNTPDGCYTKKHTHKTKPCKFYNLDYCNTVNCSFIHICGICGKQHKMKHFHPGIIAMKNTICKKFNNGTCNYSDLECDYLHICIKCKNTHSYIDCKFIILFCPLCKIYMRSNKDYIIHQFEPSHIRSLDILKKILKPESIKSTYKKKYILIM
jgi:hypothetical protein